MKILLDMNIPVQWEETLSSAGHEARHWSNVGKINAPDPEIMNWADQHGFVVFTHDLDFGALLNDIAPELEQGALVIIDPKKKRLRMLPLKADI